MNNDVVIIQLDRPRELKFNHTALKTLVTLTGLAMEEFDTQLNPSNFELIEKVAYCGLLKDAKEHGETLTLEKTCELLDEAPTFTHGIEQIFTAWSAAFGAAKSSPEGNPLPADLPAASENPSIGKRVSE